MQKSSSLHQFTLEIQQILESEDLKGHTYFDHHNPKFIKITLAFLDFHQNTKN